MSLADELIADLEDDGEEDEDDESKFSKDAESGEDDQTDESGKIRVEELRRDFRNQNITDIATLAKSEKLLAILQHISQYSNEVDNSSDHNTSTTDSPEHELIVDSNAMMTKIDDEISLIYKFLRDLYNKRFPELESLVTSSYDYIQAVYHLGNMENSAALAGIDFLTPAIKMVVSVTASTTIGQKLSEDEMKQLTTACEMAFQLSKNKYEIFNFVQSRLAHTSPNLSALLSPTIAAQLMGTAGGLIALSKMPACNLQTLGSKKRSLAGFSLASTLPHTGYIYYSDFIQKQVPPHLRRKATRLLSCKAIMAIRMDLAHQNMDGRYGATLLNDVLMQLAKWQEPPPIKMEKALPVPILERRRKRGGRRQRRMKEKVALTELRRKANIINFGEIQEDVYQTEIGFGLNSAGHGAGSGKVRTAANDERTKVMISKRLQKNLAKLNSSLGGAISTRTQIAGTASSVIFTPLQGLEIVNPAARDSSVAVNNHENLKGKYFQSCAGFNTKQKQTSEGEQQFKVPTTKDLHKK